MTIRSKVANVALLAASVAVAMIVLEVALHAFPGALPPDVRLRLHWDAIVAENTTSLPHPYLGFIYPSEFEGRIAQRDFDFRYRTDERGFRNPMGRHSGRADIVVLGDSMAFSYGVDDDEAWTVLLEEKLGDRKIVNLGLIGGAPSQYLRVYETFGRNLEAELVLLCLFPGNDVQDERLFSEWLAAGGQGNYDVWRFFRGEDPSSKKFQSHLLLLLTESVRSLLDSYSSRTLELSGGRQLNVTPGIIARATASVRPGEPDFERVLATLDQAQHTVLEDRADLVILLVPTKEEVYLPLHGLPTPMPTSIFADALAERNIEFLDLTPAFQAEAANGKQLFFEVDGHPNAAGYRLIAETVFGYLTKHP